ncbi:MAG: hypothetical protein AAF318_11420 [Pseudomonadota bacterium]
MNQAGRPPVAAFLALMAVALAPLFITVPIPLIDLPTHVARALLIAKLDEMPALQPYYAIEWHALPNLGVDLLLPPLLSVMSPAAASILFVSIIMVGVATGAVVVHRQLFGRWSLFSLLVFFLLYHGPLLWGFLNYALSIALALWGFALWLALRERSVAVRLPALALWASATAIVHLYGFGILAVLVGTSEFSRAVLRRGGAGRLALDALPFAPAIAFTFFSQTAGDGEIVWGSVRHKVGYLVEAFHTVFLPLDLVVMVVFGLVMAGLLLTRRLVVAPVMVLSLATLFAVYLAMPIMIFGSGMADWRLLPVVGIVFCAVADWRVSAAALRRALVALFGGLLALRFGAIAVAFLGAGEVNASLRSAVATVEPGERVAVAVMRERQRLGNFGLHNHLAAWALVERQAFVNSMFHNPGHQPLRITFDEAPEWRGCCNHEFVFAPGEAPKNPFVEIPLNAFDYLIVFGVEHLPQPAPPGVALVAEAPAFSLYRVADPAL